jgi:hypothetical protein
MVTEVATLVAFRAGAVDVAACNLSVAKDWRWCSYPAAGSAGDPLLGVCAGRDCAE